MFSVKALKQGDEIHVYEGEKGTPLMEILRLRGRLGRVVIENPPIDDVIGYGRREISYFGRNFIEAIEGLLDELDYPLALRFHGVWMDGEFIRASKVCDLELGVGNEDKLVYRVVNRSQEASD